MARTSNLAREKKRLKLSQRFEAKRKELKASHDSEGLQKIPRNASPVRTKNRCSSCGRPRGYYRKFGLCRICFRELANKGMIPGITKASW